LDSTDIVTRDRWKDDQFRYPPYVYAEKFLVKGTDDVLRTLAAAEREVLMGYPRGCTSALPEGEEETRNAKDLRCAAIGNSFHTNTVAAIFDKAFATMGLKKEKGVQRIVDQFVSSLEDPPEPSLADDAPVSEGEDMILEREDDEESLIGELLSPRNLFRWFTHTHLTYTHNLLTHNSFTHNLLTHKLLTYNLGNQHATLSHNLLTQTYSHTTYLHTTCPHTHNSFTDNLVTHILPTSNSTLCGKRGTWCFCVAAVALADIHVAFAWYLRHSAGSNGGPWPALTPVMPVFGVAGMQLGEICAHFVRQAWHLVKSTLLVAGVALADMHVAFVWQAWHLWYWPGSGGALGPW